MSNQAKKDCKTLIAVIISAFVYALAMKAFVETGNLDVYKRQELDTLIANEQYPVPPGWNMSPRSVFTYILSLIHISLNKEPGVYSARYLGHDTSYEIKNRNLIERVSGQADRTCRFVDVYKRQPAAGECTSGCSSRTPDRPGCTSVSTTDIRCRARRA